MKTNSQLNILAAFSPRVLAVTKKSRILTAGRRSRGGPACGSWWAPPRSRRCHRRQRRPGSSCVSWPGCSSCWRAGPGAWRAGRAARSGQLRLLCWGCCGCLWRWTAGIHSGGRGRTWKRTSAVCGSCRSRRPRRQSLPWPLPLWECTARNEGTQTPPGKLSGQSLTSCAHIFYEAVWSAQWQKW